MKRSGRSLLLGCLLLSSPLLVHAGDNSLLVPTDSRCQLNTSPEDLPAAIEACRQVAEQGDAQAQYELGELYYEGRQTERDLRQALHWFERSSLQGNAQAQLRLGTMFAQGEGVQANNVQAYIVLKMAAVNGSDEAMDSADQVADGMGKEELQAASQVLGQIFRSYLLELQQMDNSPRSYDHSPGASGGFTPQAPAFAPN